MSLESLKSESRSYRNRLSEEASRLREYQRKVDALTSLYERMKKKKEEMKALQGDLRSFVNKQYEYWRGNVFNNRYESKAREELAENDYGKMISIIDDNLDEINYKRAYYQNLIYESEGLIGDLEASINSVETQIENWIN